MESEEYLSWIKKFETKKTTDACYTPPGVFDVVKKWAVDEYGLQNKNIVRPFYPGGDYIKFDYKKNDVVIDNPPFSLISKIVRFYENNGIEYFIFAPHLTLFNPKAKTSIIVGETITFDNGAKICISFLTNLDDNKIRSAPELKDSLKKIKNKSGKAKNKYIYPPNVITSARLGNIASTHFYINNNDVSNLVGALDNQKKAGKSLFGGGYLVSDEKALELKALELKAQDDYLYWELSARELDLIKKIGG